MPAAVTPKNILDADEIEIRAYAVNFLGLDLESDDDGQIIMAKVLAAQNQNETILVMVADAPTDMTGTAPTFVPGASAPTPVGQMQGSLGKGDPRVVIRINSEERNGVTYNKDVAVGVNGVAWQLMRDRDLTVPYRVYAALKIAVRDSITHDPATNEELHSNVPAVPWQVIEMPPRAEVEAWMAATSEQFCP